MTVDPKDDYLVALLRDSTADVIVSGDPDLTSLAIDDATVLAPGELLEQLRRPRAWGHAVQYPHQASSSADYAGLTGTRGLPRKRG